MIADVALALLAYGSWSWRDEWRRESRTQPIARAARRLREVRAQFLFTCAYCERPTKMPPYVSAPTARLGPLAYPSCCWRGSCVDQWVGVPCG